MITTGIMTMKEVPAVTTAMIGTMIGMALRRAMGIVDEEGVVSRGGMMIITTMDTRRMNQGGDEVGRGKGLDLYDVTTLYDTMHLYDFMTMETHQNT